MIEQEESNQDTDELHHIKQTQIEMSLDNLYYVELKENRPNQNVTEPK